MTNPTFLLPVSLSVTKKETQPKTTTFFSFSKTATMTTDILFKYEQLSYKLSRRLKRDIEAFTGLSVAVQNGDLCQTSDKHNDAGDQAEELLVLATENSNIVAWIRRDVFHQGNHRDAKQEKDDDDSAPPTIDFAKSYNCGVKSFLMLVAKRRKFNEALHAKKSTPVEAMADENPSQILPAGVDSHHQVQKHCNNPPRVMNGSIGVDHVIRQQRAGSMHQFSPLIQAPNSQAWRPKKLSHTQTIFTVTYGGTNFNLCL